MNQLSLPISPNPQNHTPFKVLQLKLSAPPANLNCDYFYMLLLQYGPVHKIKITSRNFQDLTVLIQMATPESTLQAKAGFDAISSHFIQCQILPQITFEVEPGDEAKSYLLNLDNVITTNKSPITSCSSETFIWEHGLNKVNEAKLSSDNLTEVESKVISLRGNFDPIVTVTQIYNVFSNFGNIDRILLIRQKQIAFIQYEKDDFSRFVFENCQNLPFMSTSLRVDYSSTDSVQQESASNNDDLFIGSEETDRFDKLALLSPTQVLHVSNLRKNSSNTDTMWDVFSEFGIVEAVKVLNAKFKFMCLVKMENLQQAISCMAMMHNEKLDGRSLQISFTRSKI